MDIQKEINDIKARNRRVEAEKAWETSYFRKFLIAGLTYFVTAVVFYIIGVEKYFLNALIPTLGYLLSVQTVPVVKGWWIKKYNAKKN